MDTFEVCISWVVASFNQCFETSLHQCTNTTAKDCLFAEKVSFCFDSECCFQNYHCLKFLNFQRVTVNLSLSTDLLFKVATVTSYFSMNSEGRMSFIEQVKESVEKAAEEMREFNESVRSTVIYKSMKGHNRKTYYQGRLAAFTRHTN